MQTLRQGENKKGCVEMKTAKVIKEKLREIEADERLSYTPANVFSNAPLALIQMELVAKRDTLKWVLK